MTIFNKDLERKMIFNVLFFLGFINVLTAQLVHPGLTHKKSDLDRMKYQIEAKSEPWYSSYQEMASLNTASYDYVVRGNTSLTVVYRDAPRTNKGAFESDSRAAYYNALRWTIEGDERYAIKAIECLNAWTGLTYVQYNGTTGLSASMIYIMLEAAEIIRHTYSGWSASDIQKFEDMLVYPGYSTTAAPSNLSAEGTWYWRGYLGDNVRAGNQELSGWRAIMAIGVFLDNEVIYNRALRYLKGLPHLSEDLPYHSGPNISGAETERTEYKIKYDDFHVESSIVDYGGPGVLTHYIYENGQCAESARDQGHTFWGIGLLVNIAEIAWTQGDDFYSRSSDRILSGLDFSLRYNLSYNQSYPDQLAPWEPTLESGEFIQRLDRTARSESLAINPYLDWDLTRFTRGVVESNQWQMPYAHYIERGLKTVEEAKWIIRANEWYFSNNGLEKADTGGAFTGWGGLSYRRVSPGDPISGFDANDVPLYNMNELPMTIEAENFDYFVSDGESRTYKDMSSSNSGAVYRTDENVDIKVGSDGGYAITDIADGEWLTYTVNVPSDGTYDLSIGYAAANGNGKIQFVFNGEVVTSEVTVPFGASNSTGLSDWKNLEIATAVRLNKGVQAMKVLFSGNDHSFELNTIGVSLVSADPDPINLAAEHGIASHSVDADLCPYNGCAQLAIDGNTDGNFGSGSVSHSAHGTAGSLKWWKVDLQADYKIETISIFNRTGSNIDRLNNFTVEILDSNGVITFSQTYVESPAPSLNISTGDVVGQIVRISKTSEYGITLAEVEVYGVDAAISLSTAIFELENKIQFHPNPVENELTISLTNAYLNHNMVTVILYALDGRKVLEITKPTEKQVIVNLEKLKKGVYILELQSKYETITKKIIKL